MTRLLSFGIRLAVGLLLIGVDLSNAAAEDRIVAACRRYLATTDEQTASAEAVEIAGYQGDIDEVVTILSRPVETDRQDESGVLANQPFTCPDLQDRYADDRLHYFVPEDYTPAQPFGLIIYMHGGGRETPRDHPLHAVTHPDDDPGSIGLQPHVAGLPFILVAPSAPWNETTGARWNVPVADDYIAAVIDECCYRFHIDRDRVFLGGYSMGGFGAFHLCQRLSDRLAGGFVFSGAWKTTYWPAWTGLPLFLRHGLHDATPPGVDGLPKRPRFTDVFYSRAAHRRLAELDLPHMYVEDDGTHALRPATIAMAKLAEWIQAPRRDPYARHVVAVTPRGWRSSSDTPTPHSRWITIHEVGDGTIPFDRVTLTGPAPSFRETADAFQQQSLHLETEPVTAGVVDARLENDNRIVISTKNVRRFSLWLHPEMADLSRPIRITLNGTDQEHTVTPRLLDALRGYRRRQDWGLTYSAELMLNCPAE